MEIILAICSAFNSDRVFWRPLTTVRFHLENLDWARAHFLGLALDLSA